MAETPTKPKENPLAKFAEPKERIGAHGFDPHIQVPDKKAPHASGAVATDQHGVRVLPNGAHGMVNPQPAPKPAA